MKVFYLIVFQCCSVFLIAQQHDVNWISGIRSNLETGNVNGTILNFNNGVKIISDSLFLPISMTQGQVTISDEKGDLLFYTNGNYLVNKDHKLMDGGHGLNKGSEWEDKSPYFERFADYTYSVLPAKREEGIYYLIHPFLERSKKWKNRIMTTKVQLTKIDMNANDGLGRVVYKNRIIHEGQGTITLQFVQHGNGLDWWILLSSPEGSHLTALFLKQDEVIETVTSRMYDVVNYLHDWRDSSLSLVLGIEVNNRGDMFMYHKGSRAVGLFHFDRCTGLAEFFNEFGVTVNTFTNSNGTEATTPRFQYCFSPNDKYLYAVDVLGFYQWDITVKDIAETEFKVFGQPFMLDLFQNEVPTIFSYPYLAVAPDGKIYGLKRHNHYIIHKPNEKGDACEFEGPRALGKNVYFYTPNYPNYRLGPLKGSPCDTSIVIPPEDTTKSNSLKIYPNPFSDFLDVEVNWSEQSEYETLEFTLTDILGRTVYSQVLPNHTGVNRVELSGLPAGTYIAQIRSGDKILLVEKVVKAG